MQTQTVLIVAGAGLVGLYLLNRSQPVAQGQATKPSVLLPRRTGGITAPVPISKPLPVKNKSTASKILSGASKLGKSAAKAGGPAVTQYGCSYFAPGPQRDLCLQGSNNLLSRA